MEIPRDAACPSGGRKRSTIRPDQMIISSSAPVGGESSLLGEWSSVTGWHGIADAYLARGVHWKVMWVLVVLITMLISLNQCASMIIDFIKDDRWTSSITTKPADSLPVPTLYLCTLNIYNQSAFAENGITADKVVENSGINNIPQSILQSYQMEKPQRPIRTTPKPAFQSVLTQQNSYLQSDQSSGFGQPQHDIPAVQGGVSGLQTPSAGVGLGASLGVQSGGMNSEMGGMNGGMGSKSLGAAGIGNGGTGGEPGTGGTDMSNANVGDSTGVGMGSGGYGVGMDDGSAEDGSMGGNGGLGGGYGRKRRQSDVNKSTETAKMPRPTRVPTTNSSTTPIGDSRNYDDLYERMENSTFQCKATVISCGAGSDLTWTTTNNESMLTDQCCEGTVMDEDYCFTVNLDAPFASMLNADGRIRVANSENTIFLLLDPRLNDYMKDIIAGERPGQGFRLYFGIGYDAKYYSKPILVSPGSYSLIELTYEQTHIQLSRERGLTAISAMQPTPPCLTKANYSYLRKVGLRGRLPNPSGNGSVQLHNSRGRLQIVEYLLSQYQRAEFLQTDYHVGKEQETSVQPIHISRPGSSYHRCKLSCNESCDWKSISSVVSTTLFPAPNKVEKLRQILNVNGNNFSTDAVRRLALVEIYYGSMFIRYTERMERATVNELISNIGGTLGVWTGISLVTIYQAVAYMVMGCTNWIAVKRARHTAVLPDK